MLLVEDDPDIRLMLSLRLEDDERFVVVSQAKDGKEAIDLARAACPDLVLLDLRMPVLDGLHALSLIKELCPGAKVAVFSATADLSAVSLRESGADLVVTKGESIGGVIEALADLMPR